MLQTSPIGPPETGSFPGFFNFGVEIKSSETDRKKFLYSAKLNRIYVDMGVEFPVHFTWNTSGPHMPGLEDLYVRATVVFSDDAQKEKRVERCLQHAHEPNNPGEEGVVRNVLRSARALGTADLHYCGAARLPDSWLSVLVRLPQPAPHAYQFVCKNSCSSGINRRNTAIVFTLENHLGQILGRQSVGARVCACPKRDLRRDEDELAKGKRRLAPAAPAPPAAAAPDSCKKIKIEIPDTDDEVITLPKLQIKGAKAVVTGLEVMQRMMEVSAGEAARRSDQRALDQYSACLAGLAHALDNLRGSAGRQ
ncbi:PREDICTED: cellular tumor antigen p53-like isoform X2 [Papilio polytes]|uniref:cellular tumor antigen p53-like isoform X2 n=1 Tax=Papilio polytes TaxID=76194 RepID=UPI00067654A4|nr:PREDICTED: cellular tumor antigen p53-like isoform X2 [Papilio polytes]